MRRLLSITTICVLLASPALPLLAASCPHARMKTAMACHRTGHAQAHHCGMMQDDSSDAAEPSSGTAPVLNSAAASQDCPMDCCSAGQRTSAAAAATTFVVSPFSPAGLSLPFSPTVFTTPGFSSHTDRGPPTA